MVLETSDSCNVVEKVISFGSTVTSDKETFPQVFLVILKRKLHAELPKNLYLHE